MTGYGPPVHRGCGGKLWSTSSAHYCEKCGAWLASGSADVETPRAPAKRETCAHENTVPRQRADVDYWSITCDACGKTWDCLPRWAT